ncbi:MAG TPA: transcriptional regulator [Clostridiales bacterium]|nr:transcriptional regulator [Clostridiales bacterium]
MNFQTRLKELRKEDGVTQKTLAAAIGTTLDCIGFWENGRSEPSISEIIALAKYFGVTTDYLLGIADSY